MKSLVSRAHLTRKKTQNARSVARHLLIKNMQNWFMQRVKKKRINLQEIRFNDSTRVEYLTRRTLSRDRTLWKAVSKSKKVW